MKRNLTPIASGVALFVMSVAMSAQAQQADAGVQTVVTTGIRASLQQSLNVKRRATSNVEVVTAEDVGKMPDKNVADSLQRLPGVTISTSAAGSGGFDENDRVSLRGTSPSLTNTMINGHAVSSGDWFVLDQVGGAVGRSVSFSLLPSEIVGQVIVKKTPTADMVEGGVAGTVDILTRHPLDAKKQLSFDGSIQAVYATLPKKTDPQFNASFNWKNSSGTVGVLVQGFHEKRHLRRDGQELLQYYQVKPDNAAVLGSAAVAAINAADPAAGGGWNAPYNVPNINTAPHPDLVGVWAPRLIGSSLFEQVRTRKGGLIDLQVKPSNDLSFEATYFDSKMDASNYNRNYMMDLGGGRGAGGAAPVAGLFAQNWNTTQGHDAMAPDPGYTIKNGTLTSATWTVTDSRRVGIVDDISRPGSSSSTKFLDLDGKFRINEAWTISGKVGVSKGTGDTPAEGVYEGNVDTATTGGSVSYKLNGINSPADVKFTGIDTGGTNVFTGTTLNWIFGSAPAYTRDKDKYGQIDATFALNQGPVTDLKFGVRSTKHERYNNIVSQRPYRGPNPPYWNTTATPTGGTTINPQWNGETYPSDFAKDLGGGDFPHNVWQLNSATLDAWTAQYAWRDPAFRTNFDLLFKLNEKTNAAYVNADMEGEGWSGNAGVRVVQTKDHVDNYQIIPQEGLKLPAALAAGLIPNAGGSGSQLSYPGSYAKPVSHDNDTHAILPTFNLKLDVAKDMVARLAASRTMTRPDFGALAGTANTDDQALTGNAGNWDLKPMVSNNLDATVQWYYAPRALLSAGVFVMDIRNYVGYENVQETRYNSQITDRMLQVIPNAAPVFSQYTITRPTNVDAFVKGIELAAEVPLGAGFGMDGNFTVSDGHEKTGNCPEWQTTTSSSPCDMLGTSKYTYNLGAFYENDTFNARVGWAWRSAFLNAYDRGAPLYQDDVGTLSVSANYNIGENITLTFSGQNLNNPILKNYVYNTDQPRSFYSNGAQYYAGVRFKF